MNSPLLHPSAPTRPSPRPKWQTFVRRWLPPLGVASVSLLLGVLGLWCRIGGLRVFSTCTETFIPVGAALPFLYFVVAVYWAQPSDRSAQQDDFFSNALLEEILHGEDGKQTYTIHRADQKANGVYVFLAAVGGVEQTWNHAVERVTNLGYCAVTVQLPGSGRLHSVSFSIERSVSVVFHMIQAEFCAQSPSQSSERRRSTLNHLTANAIAWDAFARSLPNITLVAHGPACHVAVSLASSVGSGWVRKIVLIGGALALQPSPVGWLDVVRLASCRLGWVGELARRREYARLPKELRATVPPYFLNPAALAHWVCNMNAMWEFERNTIHSYRSRVQLLSGHQKLLDQVKPLWCHSNPHLVQTSHCRGVHNTTSCILEARVVVQVVDHIVAVDDDEAQIQGVCI